MLHMWKNCSSVNHVSMVSARSWRYKAFQAGYLEKNPSCSFQFLRSLIAWSISLDGLRWPFPDSCLGTGISDAKGSRDCMRVSSLVRPWLASLGSELLPIAEHPDRSTSKYCPKVCMTSWLNCGSEIAKVIAASRTEGLWSLNNRNRVPWNCALTMAWTISSWDDLLSSAVRWVSAREEERWKILRLCWCTTDPWLSG